MRRRETAQLAAVVVVASSLSALVTYRLATRHSAPPTTASSAPRAASGDERCLDFHDASTHAGEVGCVSGRVLRVYTSSSRNTFLDFCSNYRDCPFASVVFASDRDKFGNLDSLGGRQVEIRGLIKNYNGRAEIVLHDPQQLRVSD